jgi:glycerophosphoryl diester phosphodiesterase
MRRGLDDRAVIQGFDADGLARMHAACPSIGVSPLYRHAPTDAELAHSSTFAVGVGVRHSAVDPALVSRVGHSGLSLRAWTANAPDVIERLLDAGVDGLITDVPDPTGAVRRVQSEAVFSARSNDADATLRERRRAPGGSSGR